MRSHHPRALAVGALALACARGNSPAAPAQAAAPAATGQPVAPAGTAQALTPDETAPAVAAPADAADWPPTECWPLLVEHRERAQAVAACGIKPLDVAWSCGLFITEADFTAPRHALEAASTAIVDLGHDCEVPALRRFRELGDDDKELSEAIALYVTRKHELTPTPTGIEVRRPENWNPYGVDVPEELKRVVAESLRALSTPLVGWPGRAVASRPRTSGKRAPELEGALASLSNLKLHGWPTRITARVRLRGERPEAWGQALVFDVQLTGAAQSTNGCPGWTSSASASGELVVRAGDGAFVALHLTGPVTDTQRSCAKTAEGTPPASQSSAHVPCNRGELRIDVGWTLCSSKPRPAQSR